MLYVKELKRYSKENIYNIGINKEDLNELIGKNIVKKERLQYYFKFVGLLVIGEKVIFSIPKYVKESDDHDIVRQIFKLFQVYSKYENLDSDELESFGEENKENNFIALLIYMISFYLENGLYTNEHKINELNGEGEINWDKTLDEIDPIFINKQPLYLDFYTIENEDQKNNYFKNLNKYIVNKCIVILQSYGILNSLGFEYIQLEYDEEFSNVDNSIEIEREILVELDSQFITSKQNLLKAMLAFIKEDYKTESEDSIVFYGTRSFHVIWEKVCGFVLDNKFEELKNLIDRPHWESSSENIHEARTLIPDIICETDDLFVILDAKYYSIELTESLLKGQPGVEDITKQYLYQMAFGEYMGSKKFKNILLFPQDGGDLKKIGKVSIEFLRKMKLKDIELVYIPAKNMYKLYCDRKKVDVKTLILNKIK